MNHDRTVDLGRAGFVDTVLDAADVLERATSLDASVAEAVAEPRDPNGMLPSRIGGHPIIAELGRGGMGVVYLAYEPALERHVALKTVSTLDADGPQDPLVEQLLREAQTAGQLCHAGIVPIHRVGFDRDHGVYYTMRYVQGRTFAEILEGRRSEHPETLEEFPRRRLVRLFVDICRAIGFAHTMGVLHRDLKPSNLIVTEHGESMVIDWGLACRLDATTQGGRGGTVGYLAPECVRDANGIGPASDVYSLGAILYEILTLRAPVRGETPAEVITSTLEGRVEPLDPAEVWAPLVPVVQKCLSLDPEGRYPDADRLSAELDDVLEGRSPLRPVAMLGTQAPAGSDWVVPVGLEFVERGWRLEAGQCFSTARPLSGEWRADLRLTVPKDLCGWGLEFAVVSEFDPDVAYLSLDLGRDERVSMSLRRRGRLVGRCLDLRLVAGERCRLSVQSKPSRLIVIVDDRAVIDVHEPFPLSHAHLRLAARGASLSFDGLDLFSRGAPLVLSSLSLPDRLVHERRFDEARELYLELHRAHPDRGEGLAALYKAALCASERGDLAQAVREFCQLENGAMDHACALGLARVGMVDGNVDWGTTALADAYTRHIDRRTRRELWFALMGLLEALPAERHEERTQRAFSLLSDLGPDRDDAEQLVILLLDRARIDQDASAMRRLAMRLLETFADQPGVIEQALMSLHYGGLDELAISLVQNVLPRATESASTVDRRVRFLLMGGEIALATGDGGHARTLLDEALRIVPDNHPDQVWTLGWTALARWLDDDPQAVLGLMDRGRGVAAAVTQNAHLTLLEVLALTASGALDQAKERLFELSASEHLWGRTAMAMLEQHSVQDFEQFAARYPRRLLSEAAFYLAEYQRCAQVADRGQELFARIVGDWGDRALFKRFSQRRRAA